MRKKKKTIVKKIRIPNGMYAHLFHSQGKLLYIYFEEDKGYWERIKNIKFTYQKI